MKESKEPAPHLNSDQLWEPYNYYTAELSKILRQLAITSAGICWFFFGKSGNVFHEIINNITMLLIVIFFVCDILQYHLGSSSHYKWNLYMEKKQRLMKNTLGGVKYYRIKRVNKASNRFFKIKIVVIYIAFFFLIIQFISKIFIHSLTSPGSSSSIPYY